MSKNLIYMNDSDIYLCNILCTSFRTQPITHGIFFGEKDRLWDKSPKNPRKEGGAIHKTKRSPFWKGVKATMNKIFRRWRRKIPWFFWWKCSLFGKKKKRRQQIATIEMMECFSMSPSNLVEKNTQQFTPKQQFLEVLLFFSRVSASKNSPSVFMKTSGVPTNCTKLPAQRSMVWGWLIIWILGPNR